MSSAPAVLFVTQDPSFETYDAAARAEGFTTQTVGTYTDAVNYLQRMTSSGVVEEVTQCVAVVDGDLAQDVAFQIYKLLHSSHALPTLTLVPPDKYQQFALDTHRPPLDEYVPKPVFPAELILRVKALTIRAGYELPKSVGAASHPTEGLHSATVIALFSPKGGVGKSTMAINLAVGLAQFYQFKTLLVDADLWFGDAGVLLNVSSRRSIFDLASGEEPTMALYQRALVPHSSGVQLLLRPPDLSGVEQIQSDSVVRAIAAYRSFFDFIIVDTHPALDELNLQILDVADRVLLLTTPEISAIHHTARFLEIASQLTITSKLALILNRANSGLRIPALEEQLGMTISATVVSAGRTVVEAANRGVSLFSLDANEDEEVTKNLVQLVELVAGQPRPQDQGGAALASARPRNQSWFRRGGK